jgi:hypothetical protein
MITAYESKNKNDDIATGFIGWFIFNNVVFVFELFLIFRFSSFEGIIKALGVLNVIIVLALLFAKRIWICTGAFLAFMINILIWLLTRWTIASGDLWVTIIPFPLGYFLA